MNHVLRTIAVSPTRVKRLFPFHAFVVLLVLLAGMLTGCNQASSSGPVTLHVMVSAQPNGGQKWWQAVADHFHAANPDITVKLNYQPDIGASATLLKASLQAGNPLDVATAQEAVTLTLSQKGALEPLNKYISADQGFNIHNFASAMVQEATINHQIYGIPFYAQPEARQYNKDLFAKAGVQPPQTWQDLLPVCQALQKVGVAHPLYLDYGGYPALGDWASWNAFPLTSDYQHAAIDTPAFANWVHFYYDMIYTYHCIDPMLNEGGQGTSPSKAFENGQLAWHNFASFSLPALTDKDVQVAAYSLPEAGPAGRFITIGGSHLVIPKNSQHKDAAWKFISFVLMSKPDQEAIALQLHDLPANSTLANDPQLVQKTPYLVPFLKELGMKTVAAPPYAWYWSISYGQLYTPLIQLFRDPNPAHIQNYLQKAQQDAEQEIAKEKQLG